MSDNAKNIFDTAMRMEEGETLLIHCNSVSQQVSIRHAIAHLQSKLSNYYAIICNQITHEGEPYLSFVKVPRINHYLLIKQDGQIQVIGKDKK